MRFLRRVWRYILGLPRLYSIGGAVAIVAIVAVGVHVVTRPPAPTDTVSNISHVTIASVASLFSAAGPLPVTGKVASLNQATILAQTSGGITSLQVSIGTKVGAGQIIAEFENSSQQAAVLQAQGAYDAANAALAKATGSTAANAGITSTQAAQSAANSATAAMASLQSAYSALDDAVHAKADVMFSNPRSITPSFNLSLPDNQLAVTLQNERGLIEGTLSDAKQLSTDTATANIDANAVAMNADAQIIISFLNNLVQATNETIPSQNISAATITAYQTSAGAARSEVIGALSTLAASKSAYDAAASGAQTASNSATAGSQNDVAAAQANVKQALGALRSAEANLEKTIVRSPISGTIVSLPVTNGDFVSAFAQIAEVSNPGALEIDTYVTPDDAKTLTVGGKATIGDATAGIITSIAPALDPTTGKILVKIGIVGSQASLTDGDTVTVSLVRTQTAPSVNKAYLPNDILIPIAAAKITPQGAVVFTVASSTLVSHPITLGTILGDQITVTTGLSLDMDIVTDARGLADGQVVVVDSQ
jgi:RND family efflux transporter MFP subunit